MTGPLASPAENETVVREDEIVAEWWLNRDHSSEAVAIRNLAKALVAREADVAALRAQAEAGEQAREALRRIRETAIHIRSASGRNLSPEATMIVREVDAALPAREEGDPTNE